MASSMSAAARRAAYGHARDVAFARNSSPSPTNAPVTGPIPGVLASSFIITTPTFSPSFDADGCSGTAGTPCTISPRSSSSSSKTSSPFSNRGTARAANN